MCQLDNKVKPDYMDGRKKNICFLLLLLPLLSRGGLPPLFLRYCRLFTGIRMGSGNNNQAAVAAVCFSGGCGVFPESLWAPQQQHPASPSIAPLPLSRSSSSIIFWPASPASPYTPLHGSVYLEKISHLSLAFVNIYRVENHHQHQTKERLRLSWAGL